MFAFVVPVSVVTAQSVQRWWRAVIVISCIVWVALVITNALVLSARQPFAILVNQQINVSTATGAGVTTAMIAWVAMIAIEDAARIAQWMRE